MLKASKHEACFKIRSHKRAVGDYDVDRPQVQAWRHVQPSGTNSPTSARRNKRASREALQVKVLPAKFDTERAASASISPFPPTRAAAAAAYPDKEIKAEIA